MRSIQEIIRAVQSLRDEVNSLRSELAEVKKQLEKRPIGRPKKNEPIPIGNSSEN